MHNWQVCFDRAGKPGREIPLGISFFWDGHSHQALSAYHCDEGLVLDFATDIPRQEEQSFLEQWAPKISRGLDPEEDRLLRQENPLNTWHQCQVWVNGEQIKNQHASGFYWVPQDLQPEEERCENSCMDHLEHYGLEKEKVWSFRRVFCSWDKAPETISSLTVKLMAETLERSGTPFPMPTVGQQIPVEHPLTKQPHLLTVLDIQKETITIPENMAAYEMPSQATRMHYRMEPNLDWTEFYLTDCQPQDQARRKDGTPYNGGSIGMMLRIPRDGTHMAVSSMRFSAPEEVLWQPVARWKRDRDIVINLM